VAWSICCSLTPASGFKYLSIDWKRRDWTLTWIRFDMDKVWISDLFLFYKMDPSSILWRGQDVSRDISRGSRWKIHWSVLVLLDHLDESTEYVYVSQLRGPPTKHSYAPRVRSLYPAEWRATGSPRKWESVEPGVILFRSIRFSISIWKGKWTRTLSLSRDIKDESRLW
jgi:hypothetical protein